MTVSINGTSGLVFNDASSQNTSAFTGGFAFRNRIINGAMVIDQRNAGASVTCNTGANTFPLDRTSVQGTASAGVFTAQRSTVAPQGFINSLLCTVTTSSSPSAAHEYSIRQSIEGFNVADLGWGTANAKTVTISFWVRSSVTGTFAGSLTNSAFNRSYAFTYVINAANTWEQKSVTIAGDTTGTWLTDNGSGVRLTFNLGAGSNGTGTAGVWTGSYLQSATGSVNLITTNGATFYITGVQLEVGSTATSFDYRPYGTELALCQRYYFQYVKGTDQSVGIGTYYSATAMYTVIQTPVTMRAKPTLSSASGTNYYSFFRNSAGDNFDSLSLDGYEHINGAMLKNTTEMSGTAGQAGFVTTNNASAALALSSEL
jgi:hypothetical protein